MKRVMIVAIMLLVSLSVSLFVSCPHPNTVGARVYRYDINEDKIDCDVNESKSFKVAIELKNDIFNPINIKEGESISKWFILQGLGNEELEPEFDATVIKLEAVNVSRESTDKKYDRLIASLSIKTHTSIENGSIKVSIPRTSLLRNAYTKSNKGIEATGSIFVKSKFNQKVSIFVAPKSVAVTKEDKTASVSLRLVNATFKSLNAFNLDELRKSITVTNTKIADYYDFEITANKEVKDSVTINIKKKDAIEVPIINKTSVSVVVSKLGVEKSSNAEEPKNDLTYSFDFECNDSGKPSPGPSPKPEPSPVIKPENKAHLILLKKDQKGRIIEDETGIIFAKVGEKVPFYIGLVLDEKAYFFNDMSEIYYPGLGNEVCSSFVQLNNCKATYDIKIYGGDFARDVNNQEQLKALYFKGSFTFSELSKQGAELTLSIPTHLGGKAFRIKPIKGGEPVDITEPIQIEKSIKISSAVSKTDDVQLSLAKYSGDMWEIYSKPIIPGDRREVELHMVKSYDAAMGEIEYDENAPVPVLKKGVYTDVYFAIDLKKGMRFNTKYLAPTKRGDITSFISSISRDDFEYSAYLIGPRGWHYDPLHSIVVVCLHIMPKASAEGKIFVNPTIILQPKNVFDSRPMILDMGGKVLNHNIEVKDKLNMMVEEGNNAGMYFSVNRIATRHYSESHEPWTIKLVNMKIKDSKIDLSKYITLKGFAIGKDNPWADHFIKIFKEDNMGFRYVYDSVKNEIRLYKKYPAPGLPCVSFYNDINFTDGFTVTIDPSILEVDSGATLVKNSDILYYCGMHPRWN